jgi:hypothetical protein
MREAKIVPTWPAAGKGAISEICGGDKLLRFRVFGFTSSFVKALLRQERRKAPTISGRFEPGIRCLKSYSDKGVMTPVLLRQKKGRV